MCFLKRYKIYLLVIAITVLTIPASLQAINQIIEGYRVGLVTTQINAHGICKNVTSTSGTEYFVPTRSSTEWTTFLSNLPPGASAADCTTCLPNSRVATPFYPPSPACAIRNNGQVSCWNIETGAAVGGVPTTTFTAIEIAGDDTVCGITTAGTVQCFRAGPYGATNRPTTGVFVDIDTDNVHSCALRDDGQVRCWGRYMGFMAGDYGWAFSPAGTFKAISVESATACGVRTNDTVTCWGGYAPAIRSAAELAPLHYKNLVSLNDGYGLCGLDAAGNITRGASTYMGIGFVGYPGTEPFTILEGTCGIRKSDGKLVCPGVSGFPSDSFISIDNHLSWNSMYCGVMTSGQAKCWNTGMAMTLTPPTGVNASCN
jgi:Regulator of chromosome condensation (RCC1) repeat